MAIREAVIAVDFDGTVVTHEYPHIGSDIGAAPVLKELLAMNCSLILYTMRSGEELKQAVEWFRKQGVTLYAVNENPRQKRWTQSPKIFADLYIDDSNLGCPLRHYDGCNRLAVDWVKVREQLVKEGFLN